MVAGKDVCLRRLAKGKRSQEVRFNRFLGNAKVTTARVIESWGEGTSAAAEGRHILAIQDTAKSTSQPQQNAGAGLGRLAMAMAAGRCCTRCWRWTPKMAAVSGC
jgi:hypothetical protein